MSNDIQPNQADKFENAFVRVPLSELRRLYGIESAARDFQYTLRDMFNAARRDSPAAIVFHDAQMAPYFIQCFGEFNIALDEQSELNPGNRHIV